MLNKNLINSFSELSQDEYEFVIDEIAERIKDMIYMNIREKIKNKFDLHFKNLNFNGVDSLVIDYEFEFIFGDIQQIVGRIRRKNAEQKP